jgi:tol-pal system protein YbgF
MAGKSLPTANCFFRRGVMKRITFLGFLFICLSCLPSAHAGPNPDIVRLQKDVDALQKQIQELDKNVNKAFSEKIDGLKSLVVQLNDQVAKSNLTLDKVVSSISSLEGKIASARAADDASQQTLLREIRALSGKIDDTATRISAMVQALNEIKVQAKALNQEPPPSDAGLTPEAMYKLAYSDFLGGHYDLAIQEFTAYLSKFPTGEKAPSALLHTGSSYSAQNKLPEAIRAFTQIIYDYPGSESIPSALWKRAQAELAMQERQTAIDDLKDIVSKYPAVPEAEMAKAKLKDLLGEAKAITPRKNP